MKSYLAFKQCYMLLVAVVSPYFFFACRGQPSSNPPILIMRNMHEQTSYRAQSQNPRYSDNLAMRPPVTGIVRAEEPVLPLDVDEGYVSEPTKPGEENFVRKIPVTLNLNDIKNGQKKYNVYCAPCHSMTGDAQGLATQYANGAIRPPSYFDERLLAMPEGQIYKAIKHGVNNLNMPAFDHSLSVKERWEVVAYVRALQLSQTAKKSDIPENILIERKWGEK